MTGCLRSGGASVLTEAARLGIGAEELSALIEGAGSHEREGVSL